jgi:hypothetical protein
LKRRALIVLGADIDEATDEGNTALHIAASKRMNAVVGFLARAGAALNVKNNEGHTPPGVANMKPEAPKGIAVVYSRPMDDRSTAELLRQLGATE